MLQKIRNFLFKSVFGKDIFDIVSSNIEISLAMKYFSEIIPTEINAIKDQINSLCKVGEIHMNLIRIQQTSLEKHQESLETIVDHLKITKDNSSTNTNEKLN